MKLLISLLLATLLFSETHHFREVNFNGKTLKNVKLVINNKKHTFNIYAQGMLLKQGEYMIISCRAKEKFCLMNNESYYWWLEERR